jgi:predicted lipid-binding transport protein (Tim44 family)
MLKVTAVAVLMIILTGAVSCGSSTPAGPGEIAQSMLEAAQAGDYDKMKSYMSAEMQSEFNEAMLDGIEIVSFSIDEIDYDHDSTEVEVEYTITIKEIDSGETDTDDQDMDLELNSDGEWIILDM